MREDDIVYDPNEKYKEKPLFDYWEMFQPSRSDIDEMQRNYDQLVMQELLEQDEEKRVFDFSDVFPFVKEGVNSLVKDEFTKCFKSQKSKPWNWNVYLFPAWVLGILLRYCVLFPLRLTILIVGLCLFIFFFVVVTFFTRGKKRVELQNKCIKFAANVCLASWSSVVRFHGIGPSKGENQIYVANHTSLIDVILLCSHTPFATVGQQHSGLVGLIQNKVFGCIGGIWFRRSEASDRHLVQQRIQEHLQNADNNPLLIFPEGTCVNNKYCVMFKKGAFGMGAKIYPIAFKYHKSFSDPFWNSKKDSFWVYFFKLMTSWSVVCDIYFLDPQEIEEGEDPGDFANRVKYQICQKAHLKNVPWDGYFKHIQPSRRYMEYRQRIYASSLVTRLSHIDLTELENSYVNSPEVNPASTYGTVIPLKRRKSSSSLDQD